jgi:hypothetical protein
MIDPISCLDTLVEPLMPEKEMNMYNVLREYIVLNIMNQDSYGYIQSPLHRQVNSPFMKDFKEDIMKMTMRLVNDGRVVMNRSTDVSWYILQINQEEEWRSKDYLLLFDIVGDISDEVRILDKFLYQLIFDTVSRSDTPELTGDTWDVV